MISVSAEWALEHFSQQDDSISSQKVPDCIEKQDLHARLLAPNGVSYRGVAQVGVARQPVEATTDS